MSHHPISNLDFFFHFLEHLLQSVVEGQVLSLMILVLQNLNCCLQ